MSEERHPVHGQFVETYQGHSIYFAHISYSCPALKLFGYSLDTQIKAAIRKKIKARK